MSFPAVMAFNMAILSWILVGDVGDVVDMGDVVDVGDVGDVGFSDSTSSYKSS